MNEQEKKNPFQDTLNLPHTDFSIRANAQTKEPEILERWKKNQLYDKATKLNEGNKRYILHDGPPYTNGQIHLGHALNKILKDIVTKSRRMSGFHVPITPGWDCHGLPIELKVTGELGVENKMVRDETQVSPHHDRARIELKKACRAYAKKWIDIQREEFKDIGVVADWDHPYFTMDPAYEADVLRAFATFVEKGYIERKGKTVPWCFSCQTVLATAEIEYKDRKDPSIYVLVAVERDVAKKIFPFVYEKNPELDVNFLIWTTTPWSLPLNRALVLNPIATYVLLQGKEPNSAFIVGKDLADKICKEVGVEKKELAEFDADAFKGKKVRHPFVENLLVPIIYENSVLLTEGTACVHSAPGCGPEDYVWAIKNNIEIFSPLSADGKYTHGIQPTELEGMAITDGQIWVIKKLAEGGKLLHKASLSHSYPHCWRCRNGLMFRATDQWFCDLQKNDLAQRTVKEMDNVSFVPAWGKARLQSFVQNRAEWCISRQRIWGVPIPAIACTNCGHAYLNADFVRNVADQVATEGIEYWDRITLKDLVDAGFIQKDFACAECGNNDLTTFKQERDILDVWFDSGASSFAVLARDKHLGVPADIYLEGSDQHRGWFQSSILCAMVLYETTMSRTILTHGYLVDEKHHKMSKSLGNGVEPQEVIKKYSRDILRLWVATTDFENDIVMSEKLLQNVAEIYRKIRNTCRFLISNLYDFDIHKDAIVFKDMLKIDQYVLHELREVHIKVIEAYEAFNFSGIVQTLNNFCTNNLSAMYLDISKDRLYVEKADSRARRSAQTALYHILDTLTHLMAPILSFTSEEISDFYMKDKKDSIHLASFPAVADIDRILAKQAVPDNTDGGGLLLASSGSLSAPFQTYTAWILLEELRAVVLKALEEKRQGGVIKHSLEAQVHVYVDSSDATSALHQFIREMSLSEDSERFFKDWFIVSHVVLASSAQGLTQTSVPWAFVKAEHADGVKCPRCWQWDHTQQSVHMSIHCEAHKYGHVHQAEFEIKCACDPVPPQGLLCGRCKKVLGV